VLKDQRIESLTSHPASHHNPTPTPTLLFVVNRCNADTGLDRANKQSRKYKAENIRTSAFTIYARTAAAMPNKTGTARQAAPMTPPCLDDAALFEVDVEPAPDCVADALRKAEEVAAAVEDPEDPEDDDAAIVDEAAADEVDELDEEFVKASQEVKFTPPRIVCTFSAPLRCWRCCSSMA